MGTKLIRLQVDLEIDKDEYYGWFGDPEYFADNFTAASLLVLTANGIQDGYRFSARYEGQVSHTGEVMD